MTEPWRNAPPYLSGAPKPLSNAERDRLPEHLMFADKYRDSADSFDQREAECDAVERQHKWLRDECARIDAEMGRVA